MRRISFLLSVLMLSGVLAFSQGRVITGSVYDANGKPVPFASVVIKGGTAGTQTNADGQFSLRVNTGDVLEVSQAAFNTAEVIVGASNVVVATLQAKANVMQEVVVTSAFQTKRALRSQASFVQNVSSDQLNTVRQSNINNALAGKVAGVQVRSQSAVALGRETQVRLRGENGLGAGSGPIYVVDGTIVSSANDINVDDIEDITVLQGPSSAALFGSVGANGAIVINTKRARRTQKGLGIEVNSAVTFDRVYVVPKYQNSYAGGSQSDMFKYTWQPGQPDEWQALDGKYYHNYDDDASWGPRMGGQEYIPWYAWYGGTGYSYKTARLTPQENNIRDFFNTGVTATNNINFSKSGDGYSARVSYTNLDQKGLIPNEYMKRHTFATNLSFDLNSHFTVSTNVNFVNQSRRAELNDNYSNQSSGSFNQWFHRDLDVSILRELRGLRTADGVFASWNHSNPDSYDATDPLSFYGGNYWFNHYTYFDMVKNMDFRNRLFGDLSFTYKFNKEFNVRGTYRRQQFNSNGYTIYPTELQNSATQASGNPWEGNNVAGYGTFSNSIVNQAYELIGSYTKKVQDFAINANAGVLVNKADEYRYAANTIGGLNLPGIYGLYNSVSAITNSFSSPNGAANLIEYRRQYRNRAVFLKADVGYKNYLFLEGTYRKDWASAEPVDNAPVTTSLGTSFVFSDLIKDKSILSYGKARISYGQTLSLLGAYDRLTTYTLNPSYTAYGTDYLDMSEPNTIKDQNLKGSTQREIEYGVELRFLKNRFGINTTFWDRTNKNFPVTVPVTPSTGYTAIRTNAGEIAKTGVDIQLFGTPVKTKDFEWNVMLSWAYLTKNEVVSIYPGIDRLVVASGAFSGSSSAYTVSAVGQPWGQMFGGGIARDSATGLALLNSSGLYIKEANKNFGSVLPKYTGGIQNTFTIKNDWVVNVNIDYQNGGKFFSLSDFWGTFSGLTARTAAMNDRGYSVRDAVEDGGGVHVVGVDATDGHPVDMYVDAQTYFHQFRAANISENSVYDLTYVKMREVSVGYKLPIAKMGLSKYVQNATLSVIARNPWLIYAKNRDFDPSEISSVQGEDGQFPGTRSFGFNLKVGF